MAVPNSIADPQPPKKHHTAAAHQKAAQPHTQHSVDLTVHAISGSIGWHFSIYAGHSNNFGGSLFHKIRNRDDSPGSSRMNPGETWHDAFTVEALATYVLDFPDWDSRDGKGPEVEVKLIIDGV